MVHNSREVERGLLSQIRKHRLSHFGHIARHDSLQKTVLTSRIDGRRGRADPDVSGTTTSKNGLATSCTRTSS